MLKNRRIEVKLVKDKTPPTPNAPKAEKVNVAETVADITDTVVSGTITIMGSYMLVDTIRKIAISRFS